jgi:hypothetical protein
MMPQGIDASRDDYGDGWLRGEQRTRRRKEAGKPSYRLFFVRRFLLLRVGTTEKDTHVLSVGSIGAALAAVLILIFPDGVNVVLVRKRMVPP